jgi:hypothetical protein
VLEDEELEDDELDDEELELELEDELVPPMPGRIPPPHAVSAELTAPKIAKRMASVLTLLNLVTDIAINSQDLVVVYELFRCAASVLLYCGKRQGSVVIVGRLNYGRGLSFAPRHSKHLPKAYRAASHNRRVMRKQLTGLCF